MMEVQRKIRVGPLKRQLSLLLGEIRSVPAKQVLKGTRAASASAYTRLVSCFHRPMQAGAAFFRGRWSAALLLRSPGSLTKMPEAKGFRVAPLSVHFFL